MSNFGLLEKIRAPSGSIIEDKEGGKRYYERLFLNRIQSMFSYDGLPETIPQRDFKLLLHCNGFACLAQHGGDWYAFYGGLGGEPNPYYMPTLCTVANPALKLSKTYKIDEDCVIVPNDSLYMGFLPIIRRYAEMIVENDLTMRTADILQRLPAFITAEGDADQAAAEKFFEDVIAGKLGAIGSTSFMDGIKSNPYGSAASSNALTQIIEYKQYLTASLWHDLGINANYNMKREAINGEEAGLNTYALLPAVDDMLNVQREAFEKFEKMSGIKITVRFTSAWEDIHNEADHDIDEPEKGGPSSEETGGDVPGLDDGEGSDSDSERDAVGGD